MIMKLILIIFGIENFIFACVLLSTSNYLGLICAIGCYVSLVLYKLEEEK